MHFFNYGRLPNVKRKTKWQKTSYHTIYECLIAKHCNQLNLNPVIERPKKLN